MNRKFKKFFQIAGLCCLAAILIHTTLIYLGYRDIFFSEKLAITLVNALVISFIAVMLHKFND